MNPNEEKILRDYAARCRHLAAEWLAISEVTEGKTKAFAIARAANNHAEAVSVESELCATKPEPGCQAILADAANPDNFFKN